MSDLIRRTSLVLGIALAVTILCMFLTPGTGTAPASGPYQSALSNVGVETAWAKGRCKNSICEYIPPSHHCLFEGPGSNCVTLSTGGCTTVACQ